jgi:hypothetical protein
MKLFRAAFFAELALVIVVLVAGFLLAGCSADDRKAKLTGLQCYPPEIKLNSARARQEIVVQAVYADGVTRDVTARAGFSMANSQVARIAQAVVSPLTNGETELRVTFGGRSQIIPVSVSAAMVAPPISFKLVRATARRAARTVFTCRCLGLTRMAIISGSRASRSAGASTSPSRRKA